MKDNVVNLGIQIVPKSKTKDSYELVDIAIEVIKNSGVNYEVTPFETVMEGPQALLLKIAQEAQDQVMAAGGEEILVYYRIHASAERDIYMNEKVSKHRKNAI
ncbi:thiamine-binding protein [Pleomorphovibrio marinus]|uniref:thiamine-binding protein n=1 Tax=Pleomorphovibrio marinus TaxID=2164132 RepID=UPI000E0B875E|nr:thiamine-binding protein [Pleomorphovibrio marinus]